MQVRPGGLTAIAVISIVMACMGMFTVLASVVGLAAGEKLMNLQFSGQKIPPERAQAVEQVKQEFLAVNQRWKSIGLALLGARGLIVLGLLVGGIMVLLLKPPGRTILGATFLLAVIADSAATATGIAMQREIIPIQHRMMAASMASAKGGAALGESMGQMTESLAFVGYAMGIMWLLAKIVYYLVGFFYLRKPEVRALFDDQGPETPLDPWAATT
jgi:hypothetical protein